MSVQFAPSPISRFTVGEQQASQGHVETSLQSQSDSVSVQAASPGTGLFMLKTVDGREGVHVYRIVGDVFSSAYTLCDDPSKETYFQAFYICL